MGHRILISWIGPYGGPGTAHMAAVRHRLVLIRCRVGHQIVSSVSVGHVTVGLLHHIHVPGQLWPTGGGDLPLLDAEHAADGIHVVRRKLLLLHQGLCLAPRPVFVIRVLLHVHRA